MAEDEVDQLVGAWRRERPDLDVDPLAVFSRVSRLDRHLARARRDAFARHRVEAWEFDVLAALRRAGDPYQLSPGALLRATLVSSGTMTHRIERLRARGMVERLRDPDDGRGALVRLTAPGRERLDAAMSELLERERHLLGPLDARQRRNLAGLLREVLLPLDG